MITVTVNLQDISSLFPSQTGSTIILTNPDHEQNKRKKQFKDFLEALHQKDYEYEDDDGKTTLDTVNLTINPTYAHEFLETCCAAGRSFGFINGKPLTQYLLDLINHKMDQSTTKVPNGSYDALKFYVNSQDFQKKGHQAPTIVVNANFLASLRGTRIGQPDKRTSAEVMELLNQLDSVSPIILRQKLLKFCGLRRINI